jgi:hypothetical protein
MGTQRPSAGLQCFAGARVDGKDDQIIVGPEDVKLLKEHGRHIVVVMLTGMRQHLLSPQGVADGSGLGGTPTMETSLNLVCLPHRCRNRSARRLLPAPG